MSADDSWMQTFSGIKFHPLAPKVADINLFDIAHALSMLCRFAGHTNAFYSVAEHSVRCSRLCDPADAMWGLFHDAAEAYLVDLPAPLKRSPALRGYVAIERELERVIADAFALDLPVPESVKVADRRLLATEARDLLHPLHADWKEALGPIEPYAEVIDPWPPAVACRAFLHRFEELEQLRLNQLTGGGDGA